jgi:hypothetical protein
MTGHLLLHMLSSVAVGTVEMQMQFATGNGTPLLSVPSGQGNNYVVDKACGCERRFLWQQVHQGEFLRVEEERQH